MTEAEAHRDSPVRPGERGDDTVEEELLLEGDARSDDETSDPPRPEFVDGLGQPGGLVQNEFGGAVHGEALGGRLDPAVGVGDELRPVGPFEGPNMVGNRRLGHVEMLGRGAVPGSFDHLDENGQPMQAHIAAAGGVHRHTS